jgi:hypothetical protein
VNPITASPSRAAVNENERAGPSRRTVTDDGTEEAEAGAAVSVAPRRAATPARKGAEHLEAPEVLPEAAERARLLMIKEIRGAV